MNEAKPLIEQTLRWVGELDHPFYNDERQRFVWYEASTIGFQLLFLVNLVTLGIVAWVGGGPSLPYVYPLLAVQYVVAFVVIRYAEKKNAEYSPNASDLLTRRNRLYFAVLAFIGLGLIRAQIDAGTPDGSGFTAGFQQGAAWGLATAPLLIAVGAAIALRRKGGASAASVSEL